MMKGVGSLRSKSHIQGSRDAQIRAASFSFLQLSWMSKDWQGVLLVLLLLSQCWGTLDQLLSPLLAPLTIPSVVARLTRSQTRTAPCVIQACDL